MPRLFYTLIACITIIGNIGGQESKPGEQKPDLTHLKAFVGTWELTVEGVKEKGTAEIKSILGGRFITEDVKLTLGDLKMDWHGVYGYDRARKQYTGVWFDNMANTTRSDSCEADETGRIITFSGVHAGSSKFLWRLSHDGNKGMTIEMFEVAKDGKETPAMKVRGEKRTDDKTDAEKELKKFQGDWTFESSEAGGQKLPADQLKDFVLTFDGAKHTVKSGTTIIQTGTQTIDPSKSPKTIDVTLTEGPSKGTVILGIYEIEGDTLKVCFDMGGKKRPTEFKSMAGSETFLNVHKRVKK